MKYYPGPEIELEKSELKATISSVLETLCEKEKEIIRLKFGIGNEQLSISEISQKYNLREYTVKKIIKRAMDHLRQPKRKDILKEAVVK